MPAGFCRTSGVSLAHTPGGPTPLTDGVTIEVPVDEDRERTLDADAEILRQCASLQAVAPDVLLVTGTPVCP